MYEQVRTEKKFVVLSGSIRKSQLPASRYTSHIAEARAIYPPLKQEICRTFTRCYERECGRAA